MTGRAHLDIHYKETASPKGFNKPSKPAKPAEFNVDCSDAVNFATTQSKMSGGQV
jgi:hypothetical protein